MKTPIICQLCDFGPEYPGSFVDSLLCLAGHCRQAMRLETFCIFPERAKHRKWLESLDQNGIRYAFVPAQKNGVLRLREIFINYQPLIFHSHFQTFDLSTLLLKLTTYRNAKVVWHIHSIAQLSWQQRIKDLIKLRLFARQFGDLFVAVGDAAYQNAIDRGFPESKLCLNYNGIDIAKFTAIGERRERLSLRLGTNGHTIFLLLGYNPLIKGVDLFIKAAEKVYRDERIRSLFFVVGREATREFVSKVPESVRLGTSLKILEPTSNFAGLLNEIDVLIAASRSEGFGYAVIEAMAARKLIVCSDIPGVRETYGKSPGVWLFPTEDWNQLAELMGKAANLSFGERDYFGRINSQYVSEHYSLEGWAKRMGQLYINLLGHKFSKDLVLKEA